MTQQAARELPRDTPQEGSDNNAGNNTLQAGSSNFDYIESMKEIGKTAWDAAKEFVSNPEVRGALTAISQNAEVQSMMLGFSLNDNTGGASDSATEIGISIPKVAIETGGEPIWAPSSYKPTFNAFSQLDSNPADGLTQEDLLKMGSDPRLNSHAQVMAEAWGKKENFDRLAAYDGDPSTLSAEDIKQAAESKNLDLVAEIASTAEKDLKAADDRERVGLPRDASQEAYINELERRGLSNFANTIAEAAIENENDESGGFGPVEKMADALAAASAAGISMQELAKVVNEKLDPALGAKMSVHEYPDAVNGTIALPFSQGVSFSFKMDGTVDYLRTIKGENLND